MLAYLLLCIPFVAASALVMSWASRHHDPSRGKDRGWMIGWGSWIVYGILAALTAGFFDLNPLVGFILGVVSGFAGVAISFLVSMFRSPNGLK